METDLVVLDSEYAVPVVDCVGKESQKANEGENRFRIT